MANTSLGTKVLAGASAVLFIDLLFKWQKICIGSFGCVGKSGFSGIGVLVGILALAVVVWEVVILTGNAPATPVPAALISAAIGAAIVLFGIILFLSHNEARAFPAWLGLILILVVGFGTFTRFNEGGGADAVPRNSGSAGPTGPTV